MYKKMQIYNFNNNTINWMKSYLEHRTQYVTVGAHDSIMLPVKSGVPQGSVLGPTLYTLYVNEIPDIVNDYENCQNTVHLPSQSLFGLNCDSCGILPSYADDTTYVTASSNRAQNQLKIKNMLVKLTMILNANQLTVNAGKTLITELMLRQKKAHLRDNPPVLRVVTTQGTVKTIVAEKETLLLGCTLQDNTSWQMHLDTGHNALIPKLRKRLGAIKYIGKDLPQKARLLLINSYLISTLLYLLPVWAGTDIKYLNKIQVTLNNAARFVSGQGRRAHTLDLMKSCGWLTIRELAIYHTNITTWKLVNWSIPLNLSKRITIEQGNLISTRHPRILNSARSYRWRAIDAWNVQPEYLRTCCMIQSFKKMSKSWILERRPPDPDLEPDPLDLDNVNF